MRVVRFQVWSMDPLSDHEVPICGTYNRESVQRIAQAYYDRSDCNRILEARPVAVEVPPDHAYACRCCTSDGRHVDMEILAGSPRRAAAIAAGACDEATTVGVWLYADERHYGDRPLAEAFRHGAAWLFQEVISRDTGTCPREAGPAGSATLVSRPVQWNRGYKIGGDQRSIGG